MHRIHDNNEVNLCLSPEKWAHLIKDPLIIAILFLYIPIVLFSQNHHLLEVINSFLLHFQLYGFEKQNKSKKKIPNKMRWRCPLMPWDRKKQGLWLLFSSSHLFLSLTLPFFYSPQIGNNISLCFFQGLNYLDWDV